MPKEAPVKKYLEAVGRRKTAVARVRLVPNSRQQVTVNDRDIKEYFPVEELHRTAVAALLETKSSGTYFVTAKVSGGGMNAQAEAVRHGISRALSATDPAIRGSLKKLGFLTRDPRAKERRKFGLKKARKAPQWSKR